MIICSVQLIINGFHIGKPLITNPALIWNWKISKANKISWKEGKAHLENVFSDTCQVKVKNIN